MFHMNILLSSHSLGNRHIVVLDRTLQQRKDPAVAGSDALAMYAYQRCSALYGYHEELTTGLREMLEITGCGQQ